MIENTLFPFKTALTEANVKTNRTAITKLITKGGVLSVTALFLWKICFSFRTSWKELIWSTNDSNVYICIFRKRWSLTLRCYFPVSILKTLKNSKSTGPNSIPTKIRKTIKKLISILLSTIINKSFANGTFSNVCQVGRK